MAAVHPQRLLVGWTFACRDDARLSSVDDDDDTTACVCRDDLSSDLRFTFDISMGIDGLPLRSSEVDRGTSTKEGFCYPFYARCKERAKETRGN